MLKIKVLILWVITISCASLIPYLSMAASAQRLSTPIQIDQGWIQGTDDGVKIRYEGVPYALAPVGDLRWRPPQPPAKFGVDVFQAVKPGPISLQRSLLSSKIINGSEDCLYLNVYTPRNAQGRNLPVMIWIHGGAFVIGDGIQKMGLVEMYDPSALISKGDVIVVSINYRLGPLGFLAHPELLRESARKDGFATTGNYGILDQIAAIKWVNENITHFGGNSSNITIFGESAGGNSVKVHIASPLAAGLFTKAIGQSAPYMERPLELAINSGLDVANHYRKTDKRGYSIPPSLRDLRNIPGDVLVRDFPIEVPGLNSDPRELRSWAPVVDGYVLQAPILETVRRGRHNKVQYIGGTMEREMTLLAPFFLGKLPLVLSDESYLKMLTLMYGDETARRAVEKYPRREYGSNRKAFLALLSDTTFHSPAVEFIQAMEHWAPGSTYRFVMRQQVGMLKATHAFDLPYIFPGPHLYTMNYNPLHPVGSLLDMSAHKRLSDLIVRSWSRFAHTGNPNGTDARSVDPVWPSIREGGLMEFDSKGSNAVADFRGDHMEHWRSTTRSMAVNSGARCEALFLP